MAEDERMSNEGCCQTGKRHSLATSVLLDCALAFATLLGVALDPVGCLRIVPTLLCPKFRNATDQWPVVILDRTRKTELVFLVPTVHGRNDRRQRELRGGGGA